MQLIIVTGMSGAGKTTVLKILEDMGYYCVDNMPPQLITKFSEVCFQSNSLIEKVGLGIDIRGGKLFNDLLPALEQMDKEQYQYTIIFLDSSDDTLVKRFNETRRSHPLAKDMRIIDGIKQERELLKNVKDKSTHIIDTSHTLTRELREKVAEIATGNKAFDSLMITVLSFGFKHGLPTDSDLVFDVRFLPNPFYISELKALSGNDKPVADYVLGFEVSKKFLSMTNDMLKFLVPNYINEGKNQLVISIGCTGGRHRSVALANEVYNELLNSGYNVYLKHRDCSLGG